MRGESAKRQLPIPDIAEIDSLLVSWLEEVTLFYVHYNMISTFLASKSVKQGLNKEDEKRTSQHISQLTSLAITMQSELEKLVQEMDQADALRQSNAAMNPGKLLLHTEHLRQMNQQAKMRIGHVSI